MLGIKNLKLELIRDRENCCNIASLILLVATTNSTLFCGDCCFCHTTLTWTLKGQVSCEVFTVLPMQWSALSSVLDLQPHQQNPTEKKPKNPNHSHCHCITESLCHSPSTRLEKNLCWPDPDTSLTHTHNHQTHTHTLPMNVLSPAQGLIPV